MLVGCVCAFFCRVSVWFFSNFKTSTILLFFQAHQMFALITLPPELLMLILLHLPRLRDAKNARLACAIMRTLIPDIQVEFVHKVGWTCEEVREGGNAPGPCTHYLTRCQTLTSCFYCGKHMCSCCIVQCQNKTESGNRCLNKGCSECRHVRRLRRSAGSSGGR